MADTDLLLERKFCRAERALSVGEGARIEGYASVFGHGDQGGDVVGHGAFARSLAALAASGGRVKMLWQHDPATPIGIWEEVREDAHGLYVTGRFLTDVAKGREAASLVAAGAIDGLSIGYRTKATEKDAKGRRVLTELELWEVSLVTFPMLSAARVGAKGESAFAASMRELAGELGRARRALAD